MGSVCVSPRRQARRTKKQKQPSIVVEEPPTANHGATAYNSHTMNRELVVRAPKARLCSQQHRVLIYITCYNVLDG
jgi:hypothetical protein